MPYLAESKVQLSPPEESEGIMSVQKTLSIGQRIRFLRGERGMSQAELARLIGITPQSLGGIELGKSKSPSAVTLLRLAAALDANPEWIIHGRGKCNLSDAPGATTEEFIRVFEALSPEHQAALLAAAKSLR